jgi:hypothetical protein
VNLRDSLAAIVNADPHLSLVPCPHPEWDVYPVAKLSTAGRNAMRAAGEVATGRLGMVMVSSSVSLERVR